MYLNYKIKREEINAIVELYGAYDSLYEAFGISLGMKDQMLLMMGKSVVEPIGNIGEVRISKKHIEVVLDIPQKEIVAYLNMYSEIIIDIADIVVPTKVLVEKLIEKYMKRIENV